MRGIRVGPEIVYFSVSRLFESFFPFFSQSMHFLYSSNSRNLREKVRWSIISLTGISYMDAGDYKCKAKNLAGMSASSHYDSGPVMSQPPSHQMILKKNWGSP